MKSILRFTVLSAITLLSTFSAYAVATVGTVTTNRINIGTNNNFIVVNGITGASAISVSASSSDNAILSVTSVNYVSAQKIAIINVKEFGNTGSVTLTVTANDGSPTNKDFTINVGNFYPKGTLFSIFDIVFWTETYTPTSTATSLYDSIIPFVKTPGTDEAAVDVPGGLFDRLPLTVGSTPYDGGTFKGSFYTAGFKGFFTPTATGVYLFSYSAQDIATFRIYKRELLLDNELRGGFSSNSNSPSTPNTSDTVHLVAGRKYAFGASNGVVYSENFKIQYAFAGTNPTVFNQQINSRVQNSTVMINNPSIAGLNMETLGGDLITPYNDGLLPTSNSSLILLRKSNNQFDLKWNKFTDNVSVKGYKVYLDGILWKTINNDIDTTLMITGLAPNTNYSVYVTAFDVSGNESFPSNIINSTTFPVETIAPTSPNSFTMEHLGDLSAKVSWSGATDESTGIYGYRVFIDGSTTPYNSDTLNSSEIILKTFLPNSAHTYTVQAIDGAGNASPLSDVQSFTTLGFNPMVAAPGIKKVRLNVFSDYTGRSEGLGINGDWNTSNINQNFAIHQELKPGLVRWGTLDANRFSYGSKTGTSTSSTTTYAEFVDFADRLGAYASISIGTDGDPSIDWRDDPTGTMQKFIGYMLSSTTTSNAVSGYSNINSGYNRRASEPGMSSSPLRRPSMKGLFVEFGNEPWGGTSNGVGVDHNADGFGDYLVYGKWCRELAYAAKHVPSYDSSKITLFYSGREPKLSESYGLHQALLGTPYLPGPYPDANGDYPDMVDGLSLGGYIGGNYIAQAGQQITTTELNYYKSSYKSFTEKLSGLQGTINLDMNSIGNTRRGRIRPFYYYESNMTTPAYNKRFGQALTSMDYYMSTLKYGSTIPTVFVLFGGEWGMVENDGFKNPQFHFVKLINTHCKSNILRTSYETLETLKDENNAIIDNPDAAPISMHAYHKNGKYVVMLMSRDYEHDYDVQLNLPNDIMPTGTGKRYRLTATDFSSKNTIQDSVAITVTDNMIINVPKYGMVLITFSGNTLDRVELPLGYTKFNKPTQMTVQAGSGLGLSPNIEEPYETMKFNVSLSPSVPGADFRVKWSMNVSKPEMLADLFTTGGANAGYFEIQANGCPSEGTVTVMGSLMDDPNIKYSQIFNITGQLDVNTGEPCVTGVKSSATQNHVSLSVYPNPSNGVVTLKSSVSGDVLVMNTQGQVVQNATISAGATGISLSLDAGIYIIKLSTSKGTSIKKVIISK